MIKPIFVAALLLTSSLAQAQGAIIIPRTVPYAEGIGSDAVRNKCDWNTQLSTFIVDFAKSGVVVSDAGGAPATGKMLSMTIVGVHSVGGGGFTGPKWATVRGELREGGTLVGSFVANRTTTKGGLTACSALIRVGKAIGKDIAVWLRAPSLDATLGNAR